MSTHKSFTPPVPIEFYDVGDIYITTKSGNPYTWLQYGVWERIQDRFLLAAGSTYTAGSTGGAATHKHTTQGHTLTINEIPSHNHVLNYRMIFESGTSRGGVYQSGTADGTWNTGKTGGGASHTHGDTGSTSSLPPYLAVYVWKRTA